MEERHSFVSVGLHGNRIGEPLTFFVGVANRTNVPFKFETQNITADSGGKPLSVSRASLSSFLVYPNQTADGSVQLSGTGMISIVHVRVRFAGDIHDFNFHSEQITGSNGPLENRTWR